MPKNSGFTLIELLVVISIIALLTTIGLLFYGKFVKNSRDTRRLSDLKLIQTALEDYHSDQLNYPPLGTGACSPTGDGQYRSGCSLTNSNGVKTYLNTIPTDPKGVVYSYVPSPASCSGSSCVAYCLYITLEIMNLTSDPGCSTAPPYGVSRP